MKILRKIKKMFSSSTLSYLMVIMLLTKVLGLLKLRVIATLFGTSRELDIFWAAFTIPDMAFNILISGSINAAIIPIFSQVKHKGNGVNECTDKGCGDRDLAELFTSLNFVLAVFFIIFALICFIFAEQFSRFILSADFLRDALDISSQVTMEDVQLLTLLTRIVTLTPVFLGINTIISGYIVVYRKFFVANITPLIYNLVILVTAVLLVKAFDLGVIGLAVAVLLGSIAQLVVQLPTFFSIFKPNFKLRNFGEIWDVTSHKLLYMFKISLPRSAGFLLEQASIIFNKMIGFTLSAGAVSVYQFAFSLHFVPVHLITGSISQVALTNFSELYSKNKMDEFKLYFNNALQVAIFLVLPCVAVLLVLRLPIVRLVYGAGQYDWSATRFTSWSLALLSLAVFSQVVVSILLRGFYAIQETRLPLIATALKVVVNIVATYYFTNFFSNYVDWRPILDSVIYQITHGARQGEILATVGNLGADLLSWFTVRSDYNYAVGGIALGFSIAYFAEMLINLGLFKLKTKKIVTMRETLLPAFKKIFVTFVTIIFMYASYVWLDNRMLDTTRTVDVIAIFGLVSLVCVISYLSLSWIFRVKELFDFKDKFFNMVKNE